MSEAEYQQLVAETGLGSAMSGQGDEGHSHGETVDENEDEETETGHVDEKTSESAPNDHHPHEQ